MADISFRWNRDEQELKDAFDQAWADERTRDPEIKEGAVAKKIIRRGLETLTQQEHSAAIAEAELAAIHGQVNKIAQGVRKLDESMDSIREDLATAVYALLQHAGKVDAAKAQKWIEEEFKS